MSTESLCSNEPPFPARPAAEPVGPNAQSAAVPRRPKADDRRRLTIGDRERIRIIALSQLGPL